MGTKKNPCQDLIQEALAQPDNAIAYRVSRQLAALHPEKAILEGDACSFGLEEYAAAGQCTAERKPAIHSRMTTGWQGPGMGLVAYAENTWFEIGWQGHAFDVLLMTWTAGMRPSRYYWILADSKEVAERFYLSVCEWGAEVRGEVLVFEGGAWQKSESLFHAIQDATFENLVLHGSLKRQIQDDLAHFFASRELYEEYRVPWKRGILFIGPPGNGKTHAVKALINSLRQPCLYVKSFKSEFQTDHDSIRAVFRRARQTAPCLLVLEDLDSLINGQNRSFFLNELDGFAANAGIATLATTNHPERLDPAILNRPSRFDRKYPFELPGPAERVSYIRLWNDSLQPALRLAEPEIVELAAAIEGFSFAYVKELFLSASMRWIASPEPGGMPLIMMAQAGALREQMSSASEEPARADAVDEERPSYGMMSPMTTRRIRAMMRRQQS
jgi:hypothetical protein